MERELKREEELGVEISEAHPLAVLYRMVCLCIQAGTRPAARRGVMVTVVVWFYRRVTGGRDFHHRCQRRRRDIECKLNDREDDCDQREPRASFSACVRAQAMFPSL